MTAYCSDPRPRLRGVSIPPTSISLAEISAASTAHGTAPSAQLQDRLFPLAVPRPARTASPTLRRPEAHKQRFDRQRELQTRLQDRQPGTQRAFIQYFCRVRSSRARLFLTRGRRGPGPGPPPPSPHTRRARGAQRPQPPLTRAPRRAPRTLPGTCGRGRAGSSGNGARWGRWAAPGVPSVIMAAAATTLPRPSFISWGASKLIREQFGQRLFLKE